jgi:S-DNA-T family DNA segregation ATPase FtsK/SpoIIIE
VSSTTTSTTSSPAERKAARGQLEEAPKVRRLSTWEPDVRWAHPLETALWCYCLALVADYPAFGIPPIALALLAPIAAAIGVGRARRAFPENDYGHELRASMSVLAIIASCAASAWLVYACWTSPLHALGMLVIGFIWFGGWYWVLRTSAPKAAARVLEEREQALIERATATWTEILEAANLPLRIVETQPTRAGYVLGVEPIEETKPVTFAILEGALPDLTTKASSLLAREGVTVSAGTIRVEPTEAAHVHLIHVCTKHILRESIDYEPFEQAPGTIGDPLDYALFEDGQHVTVTFGGEQGGANGKIVGATGSGKSRLTNSIIGRVGECGDVLVGVVASNKLVPLVYPWIKPWLEGKCPKPALDFVAGQHPGQALLMLAAVYQIVCERNARLSNEDVHTPTPKEPAIVCFVEEAGKLASAGATVELHTGQVVGFSQLLHMILGENRSAQVSVWAINQTDLYNALGDYGAEIARNTPYRICLKTLAPQDGQSVLPGLKVKYADTAQLKHNSMLVQPSIDEPRVMPAKAYNLAKDLVAPIAERNGQWRPELEADIADQLGEVWTGRWDASRLPELAAAAARDGLEWPVGQLGDEMDQELWQMIEQETGAAPAAEQQTPEQPAQPKISDEQPGAVAFPDAEAAAAELREIAKKPAITLPEPLQSVITLLRDEQAPRDFISTRQLAILLDRVVADAPEADLKEAARKLGREMASIDEEIRTEQRGRLQGYDVPKLKQIAARLARRDAE